MRMRSVIIARSSPRWGRAPVNRPLAAFQAVYARPSHPDEGTLRRAPAPFARYANAQYLTPNLTRVLSMLRFHPRTLAVAALAVCLAVVPSAAPAADDGATPLKKGERIVFLGDSITQAGAGPGGYVSLIRKALAEKRKDLYAEVIGAGISGNKVPDLQRRLQRDVLAKKPTLVVIYIGINDVWHGEKDPTRGTTPERFEDGLKEVVGKAQ